MLENKTVVTFDVETTGVDINIDQIIQISIEVERNGEVLETFNSYVDPEDDSLQFRDGLLINQIDWNIIASAPPFIEIASKILSMLNQADILIGFNIQYDLKYLTKALITLGGKNPSDFKFLTATVLDPYQFWIKKETRKLKDAIKKFLKKDESEFASTLHDSLFDISYTRKLVEPMIKEFGSSIEEMIELTNNKPLGWCGALSYNSKNQFIFNFGKHAGKTISEVKSIDSEYLKWCVESSNFDVFTKEVIKKKMM